MSPIGAGADAPPIPGVELEQPGLVLFYKVTCPTCQISAPVAQRLAERFPGRFAAVAQDPPDAIEGFGRRFGASFTSVSESPPYDASNAYDVDTVPTLFLVEDAKVVDVAESWDRDAWNRLAARLGEATGSDGSPISQQGDGLPPFRPG